MSKTIKKTAMRVAKHSVTTAPQARQDLRHMELAKRLLAGCNGLVSVATCRFHPDGSFEHDYSGSPLDLVAMAMAMLDAAREFVPPGDQEFIDRITEQLSTKLGLVLGNLGASDPLPDVNEH